MYLSHQYARAIIRFKRIVLILRHYYCKMETDRTLCDRTFHVPLDLLYHPLKYRYVYRLHSVYLLFYKTIVVLQKLLHSKWHKEVFLNQTRHLTTNRKVSGRIRMLEIQQPSVEGTNHRLLSSTNLSCGYASPLSDPCPLASDLRHSSPTGDGYRYRFFPLFFALCLWIPFSDRTRSRFSRKNQGTL